VHLRIYYIKKQKTKKHLEEIAIIFQKISKHFSKKNGFKENVHEMVF